MIRLIKELAKTERGSCLLLATACVPITAYTLFAISSSPVLDALAILLNVAMFLMTLVGNDED